MSINSLKARLLQKKVLGICILIVGVVIAAAAYLGIDAPKPVVVGDNVAYNFSKDIDRHGFEWDFSNRVDKQSKDIEQLKEKVESKTSSELALNDALENAAEQNKELEQRLEVLEEKLYTQSAAPSKGARVRSAAQSANFNDSGLPDDNISFNNPRDTLPLSDDESRFTVHRFALEPKSASRHRNIATTIPSNSFIKAKLANGVDVSASQSSQQNPKPVLLTITGWGNLPNGHKLRTLKLILY